MSALSRPTELDRRLARLIGTLDTAPGFEARLRARVARELPARDAGALAGARAALLRERLKTEATLRRALRTNLLLLVGAVLAAVGPAWLCGRILGHALSALPSGGALWVATATGAAFIGWLWAALRRAERGENSPALLV